MDLDQFQRQAAETDQYPIAAAGGGPDKSVIVPLLGLAGESGSLLSEYKKFLRDGSAHEHFVSELREELGDLMWYIAIVAGRFGLSLNEIAGDNLAKAKSRWGRSSTPGEHVTGWFYDDAYETSERLPRQMDVEMTMQMIDGREKAVMTINGKPAGTPLTDNRWEEDFYRFHDVLHLAFATYLGWSPVIRKLLGNKRRSNPKHDEIEDGGRAAAVEEGISALVYMYAENHGYFQDTHVVDYSLLKIIKGMTEGYEVRTRKLHDWQLAIVHGIRIWNCIKAGNGGKIHCNLETPLMRQVIEPA